MQNIRMNPKKTNPNIFNPSIQLLVSKGAVTLATAFGMIEAITYCKASLTGFKSSGVHEFGKQSPMLRFIELSGF